MSRSSHSPVGKQPFISDTYRVVDDLITDEELQSHTNSQWSASRSEYNA